MKPKFQIFISSTYEDLKIERDLVIKATLEMGHIPIGMEMFSAGDEAQWKIITRQIDECDYYVVIIAHRYGSTEGDISYTEKEYDYAIQHDVPVLGFIIDGSAPWPSDKTEKDNKKRIALDNFKIKAKKKMVSFWKSKDDLYGKYSIALSKLIETNPGRGWIKNPILPSSQSRKEMVEKSPYFKRKLSDLYDTKQLIARYIVSELLQDGDYIFMTSGTSSYTVAEVLAKSSLTAIRIVTNSIPASYVLSDSAASNNFEIYQLGGEIQIRGMETIVPESTEKEILTSKIWPGPYKAIISATGFNTVSGAQNNTKNVVPIKREMINISNLVILPLEPHKIGLVCPYTITNCGFATDAWLELSSLPLKLITSISSTQEPHEEYIKLANEFPPLIPDDPEFRNLRIFNLELHGMGTHH